MILVITGALILFCVILAVLRMWYDEIDLCACGNPDLPGFHSVERCSFP